MISVTVKTRLESKPALLLAVLAAVLWTGCQAQVGAGGVNRRELNAPARTPTGRVKTEGGKGETPVGQIELTVSLRRPEVVVGESIEARIEISNRGSEQVQVHSPESESPFLFQLASRRNGQVVYSLSQKQYQLAVSGGDPLPPYTPPMESLVPGASQVYDVDVAQFATAPIAAGRYLLSVHYSLEGRDYASDGADMEVLIPRIEGYSDLIAPLRGVYASSFFHRSSNGSLVLYERESRPGAPDLGVSTRCREFEPKAADLAAALAVEVGSPAGLRWLAWLADGSISAHLTGSRRAPDHPGPVPTGLSGARLVGVGRKLEGGRAAFLVYGREGRKTRIKEFTFSMKEPPRTRGIDLVARSLPGQLLPRYSAGGEEPEVALVWGESDGAASKIRKRTFASGETGNEGGQEVLLDRKGGLLAMAMSPVAESSTDVADLLLEDGGKTGNCTYLRISLSDGKPIREWSFAVPGDKADDWALAAAPLADMPVLAKAGTRLLWTSFKDGGRWAVVAEGIRDARFLRLICPRESQVWASWYDPAAGIIFRRLR